MARMDTEAVVEKEWLTYDQCHTYCGLSRTRLWELLREKKIHGVKDGTRVRISKESLDRYLASIDYAKQMSLF